MNTRIVRQHSYDYKELKGEIKFDFSKDALCDSCNQVKKPYVMGISVNIEQGVYEECQFCEDCVNRDDD